MLKKTIAALFLPSVLSLAIATPTSQLRKGQKYTVINYHKYQHILQQTHKKITSLLTLIHPATNKNEQVIILAHHLVNTPYAYNHVEGEGDWCSNQTNYQQPLENCPHIQQDPIYRTDQFNCTTLVETILALLNATKENFNNIILHVEYGAADLPYNKLYYCNRNNFLSADFNPINQKNNYLKDITRTGRLHLPIQTITTKITPIQWFQSQMKTHQLKTNVRVLKNTTGPEMVKRFTNNYLATYCPKLTDKEVVIHYIPKKVLVKKVHHFFFKPTYEVNKDALNKIPTPSVFEIIRNDKKWIINEKHVSQLIGSGLNVSHSGILYRESFKKNQFIFNSIQCQFRHGEKVCHVVPNYCKHSICKEVMVLAASDAYPDGYHYYKQHNHFVCTAKKPHKGINYTSCNRVFSMPLANYLVQKEYGYYTFAQDPSIVGIHLEKII